MIKGYKTTEDEISICSFCRNSIDFNKPEYIFNSVLDISRTDIEEGGHEMTIMSLCEECYISLIELKPFLDKSPDYAVSYKIGGSINDFK